MSRNIRKPISLIAFGLVALAMPLGGLTADSFPQPMRGVDAAARALVPEVASDLKEWNCNAIRVVIAATPNMAPTTDDPLVPYGEDIDKLRQFLPAAREKGISLVVAVDPFGRNRSEFWDETPAGAELRTHVAKFWSAFARKFDKEPGIVAYDLVIGVNDPHPGSTVWVNELLPEALAAVRAVNQDIWVVAEAGVWGRPSGLRGFKPLADPHVIYGITAFFPDDYVYQGISPQAMNQRGKLSYPSAPEEMTAGAVEGNRESLAKFLQPVVDFAEKNEGRIMVVSFGVARWAPGAGTWTEDMTALFEEHGWDWFYSSTVGYNAMNPTYSPDDPPANTSNPGGARTAQLEALLKGWKKNKP